MSYIKGKELMLCIDADGNDKPQTIAYATSHTLSMSSSLSEVLTKDDNDKYLNQEVTEQDWSLTTENLIASSSVDEGYPAYEKILELMKAGEPVSVMFASLSGSIGRARVGTDWVEGTGESVYSLLEGKALITSIELNADNKENVSYTATFQGVGAPTMVEHEPTLSFTNVNDYPGCALIVGDNSASALDYYFNLSVSEGDANYTVDELYLDVYGTNGSSSTGTVGLTAETGNVDFHYDDHRSMSSFVYTHKAGLSQTTNPICPDVYERSGYIVTMKYTDVRNGRTYTIALKRLTYNGTMEGLRTGDVVELT